MWFAIILSLAALFALAGLFQFLGAWADARRFPPPGRLLDIGGRRLHACVEGHGPAAVVFESGISATSINWRVTQAQVAAFATACSYDRAGLGWSDPCRTPLDAGRMVADLSALLDQLNLPSPYVLVGHSFGGLLVRLFVERYPHKVAGMVLVDPVLAYHWAHPDSNRAAVKRKGASLARWGAILASLGVMRVLTSPALVTELILPRFGGTRKKAGGVVDRLQTELRKLPVETWPAIRALWCRPATFRALAAHLAALEDGFTRLRNQPVACPLIVLSAGNTPPEGLAEHQALAALSPRGEHIVARNSGHWIQFDEPQLIIDAIRRAIPVTQSGGVSREEPGLNDKEPPAPS